MAIPKVRRNRKDGLPTYWTPPCASAQAGVFTRKQASLAGLTRGGIDHRIASAAWKRVAGQGWTLADNPITLPQGAWAATLTWPDAVLCGPTALRLQQPDAPLPADGQIHVALPHFRADQPRLTVHQSPKVWQRGEIQGGLRLSGYLDALADCLRWLPPDQADSLVAWMVTRRIVLPDSFAPAVTARRKHPGVARLDQYKRQFDSRAASAFELLAHDLLDGGGITGWTANAPIRVGGRIIAVADILFELQRLIIECDGYAYHSGREAFERDRARDAQLQANGYRIIRLTYDRIMHDRAGVLVEIRQALTQPSTNVRDHRLLLPIDSPSIDNTVLQVSSHRQHAYTG